MHESRRVTTAVNDVLKAVRRRLPTPPPATRATLGGRPRRVTPPADATDHPILRWRWRETSRAVALARVHELRRRGLSLREITRQTGLNRRTVTKWLRYETPPPDLVACQAILPAPVEYLESPPPAPWTSWQEIEWYAIWRDAEGERPLLLEAQVRYERWRANAEYRQHAPLRRVQESVDRARFERLSCFLQEPTWQATSNGAERMGRTFRHRQGPHFNLRTATSIAADLTVRACLQKKVAPSPVILFGNRCPQPQEERSSKVTQQEGRRSPSNC